MVAVILLLVAGLLVARVILVRRATPDAVARWLHAQADRLGIPLVLGEVRAPAAGRIHIASIEAESHRRGIDAVGVRLEDVAIDYELEPLRRPPVSVKAVTIGAMHVTVHAERFAGGDDRLALAAYLGALRDLPHRVAVLLPGVALRAQTATVRVLESDTEHLFGLDGESWTTTISSDATAIHARGVGWAPEHVEERGELELTWTARQGIRLDLRGVVPDVPGGWARASALWPDLQSLPVEWRAGHATWQSTITELASPGWFAEGEIRFTDVDLRARSLTVGEWSGVCQWSARAATDTGLTRLDSLSVRSNYGDATASGAFGMVDGVPTYSGAAELYGLDGAQIVRWFRPVLQASPGALKDVRSVEAGAVTVELEGQGAGPRLTLTGRVEVGSGAIRLDVLPEQAYLRVAEVDTTAGEFTYDSSAGALSGRMTVVDGGVEFTGLDVRSREVQGVLEFDSEALTLAPLQARIPGADVLLRGRVPLRPGGELALDVESQVSDVAALLGSAGLPKSVQASGAAVLTAHITGTGETLRSQVAIEGTQTALTIGDVVRKEPGLPATLHGVLRPLDEGFAIEEAVLTLSDATLRGSLRASPREGGWWWGVLLETDRMPLPTLRRVSPVTRVLGGYGNATLHFAYSRTPLDRRVEAQLSAAELRCEPPRSPYTYLLSRSQWRLISDVEHRWTRIAVTGETVDILDPLPDLRRAGRIETTRAERDREPADAASEWETAITFDFQAARWRTVHGRRLQGTVRHHEGETRLDPLHVEVFDGMIAGIVTMDPNDTVDVFVRWSNCELDAILSQAYDMGGVAQGLAYGSAYLYGPSGGWPAWRGHGGLRLELPMVDTTAFTNEPYDVRWRQVSADSAWATFNFDSGTFTIPDLFVERPGIAITGAGNIDLDGNLDITCKAQVDNDLVEQLPLMARARFTRRDSPDTREVEFTLRDNIRTLQPTLKKTGVASMVTDIGRGTMERSGQLLLDLLGW